MKEDDRLLNHEDMRNALDESSHHHSKSHHSSSHDSSSHHSSSHHSSSHHSHHSSHHSSHHHSEKKRKKKKVFSKIIIAIVCVVLCFSVAGAAVLYFSLNKINYEKPALTPDPDFKEEIVLPEDKKNSDIEIDDNINNNLIMSDKNVINILLVGEDYGEKSQYYPRSDSMMIFSINKNDSTLRLASLSRAVYVGIEGFSHGRLNSAYAYGGPDLLISTIEKNYKIKINNYIAADFDAFTKIIDIFGGVDISLSKSEINYIKKIADSEGQTADFLKIGEKTYHLNGKAALAYARFRKQDNDRTRTGRQRTVLTALSKKAKDMSVSQLKSIVDEVFPLVTTSLNKVDIITTGINSLQYMSNPIKQTVIPDKSSDLILTNNVEVLLVDWGETVSYTQSFFYPNKVQ